ncbi:MAG: hypothetical protein HQL82_01640 [Magnetococcales bacterium]|nr:hypothetical protein [Magnetococcales bacterium]
MPKPIAIPILEAGSVQIKGGFCSSRDALTAAELEALAQLRRLREQGEAIKGHLRQIPAGPQREALTAALAELRAQAAHWRERREQATRDKHVTLGHGVALPLDH